MDYRIVIVSLRKDVHEKYDIELKTVGAIGVSAMMHGYMPFDEHDNLLVPFPNLAKYHH